MNSPTSLYFISLLLCACLFAIPEDLLATPPRSLGAKRMDLQEAVALALRHSNTVESAYLDRIVEKFNLKIAQDEFRPDLTLSASALYNQVKDADTLAKQIGAEISLKIPTGGQFNLSWKNDDSNQNEDRYSSSVSLSFTQPLLKGAGFDVNLASQVMAERQEQSNLLKLQSVLTSLITQVIETYRDFFLAQRQMEITRLLKCTKDYFIEEINWSILLLTSTVQRQFYTTEVKSFIVRRSADSNHLLVSAQIKQYFAKRVKGLKVRRIEWIDNWIKYEKKEVQRTTLLSLAIGGLSLLAGSIGIMNVMLTAVIERRREIGILRAIGARQRDIRWQFLLEAMILSLIGGLLGSGLGIATAYLIAWWNEWQFFMSYQILLLGVGVSWGVGIFFGFYPAYKVAKLDPIIALRTE